MEYIISDGKWSTVIVANSLEEAQTWTLTNLGSLDYSISLSLEPINIVYTKSTTETLQADMAFGQTLILEFLLDNRNDPNIKSSDSLILLQKFQAVKELLSLGDVKKCLPLITAMTVDAIFTQERKDKYLTMLNNYINP